jgi:hypothetical protein
MIAPEQLYLYFNFRTLAQNESMSESKINPFLHIDSFPCDGLNGGVTMIWEWNNASFMDSYLIYGYFQV